MKVSGNISYASQEPWVFPGSIKQNITFGEKFNQERYEDVIEVCSLKRDFNNLPEGDQTCLIDKGLNLSRGQKARINLARAIYKEADIYLLDDCLSAVDVLVCKHIFYKCIKSYLLNKICVLVSNQTQFLSKANNVVILSKGIVIFNGGFEKFQQWNDTSKFILNDEINNSQVESISEFGDEKYGNNENPVDNIKNLTTNSIYKESKERGSVKTRVYYKYFQQGGGLKMIILLLGLSVGSQAFSSWADYFVSFWVDMEQDASKYSTFNTTNDAVDYINLVESRKNILIQYSLVMLGAVLLKVITSFAFFIFTSKSSLNLHVLLLNNVLNAGMTFFDTNLSGNVLNRFSRDLGVIDEQIPPVMLSLTDSILTLIGSLFIVTSVSIYTLAPCLTILIILIIGKKLYLLTARSIRRLEGTTRSPVVGHLNATLEGLATIRANKAEEILKDQFDHHQNLFNSVTYMCMSTERAFGFYMSTLGFLYLLIITFSFLFMKTKSSAGEIGLAITQSFTVIDLLYIAISNWAEFEIEMTSTERVIEYIKTKPEDSSGSKVLKWTRCGKIIYENVNLYYFSSGEPILNNVSFIIQPCQKIGIVGRTGAGKSSVIFSLFKLYNVKGKISIDDIDIKDMESSFLRSNISIIPQDPVLFSGTIRTNLDPYGIHTDEDLWNALEKVKIKSIIISLNSIITDGGVNYSIGQRQLLCLARALLRKNTILVLDEATANVDSNVDQLIQNIMNTAFSNYTIITIAHRLSTIINCDKVLVMDSGKLIEYDSPSILLSHKKGMFYKMVKESVFS